MNILFPITLLSVLALHLVGCSSDDTSDSSTDGTSGAGGETGFAGTGQGGAGASGKGGTAGAGGGGPGGAGGKSGAAGQGNAGTGNKGGSAQGGAGSSQGGAGQGQGGAGQSQGGAGQSQGGSAQGGAGSGQAGQEQGGAGSGQAGQEQGGAGMGAGGGTCSPAVSSPEDMLTPHLKGSTCAKLGYYDYLPAGYGAKGGWPLIIAFHGDGERGNGGSDLPLLLNNGLTQDIPQGKWDPQKRFVVLAPQMDDRNGMTERTGGSVNDFIAFARANYAIDAKRIYLTGLSGGGEPVYNYLGDFAGGEVAATNINAGWYSTQGKECSWKDIPIWYFHAAMDNTVPPAQHTTVSYNNLVACNPGPAVAPRYTMYLNLGHSAWAPTYDLTGMDASNYPLVSSPPGTTPYDISLYDWFLQYSR